VTREEVRNAIFEALYQCWVEDVSEPRAYVGINGEHIVVLQRGGEHFIIRIDPAQVEVASG
jgi:hypothetical protein